jgi:hypothetical protein
MSRHGDKVCQWLAASLWISLDSDFLHHSNNWLSQYNWNIVESGIKYHNPHPPLPRINNFELTDFHYDDNVLFQGIEQIKNEVEDPGEQMIDSIHGHGR